MHRTVRPINEWIDIFFILIQLKRLLFDFAFAGSEVQVELLSRFACYSCLVSIVGTIFNFAVEDHELALPPLKGRNFYVCTHTVTIATRDTGSSLAIYNYMLPHMADLKVEQAHVLLMNQNFRLIKSVKLSEGGITETSVDIRILMREAVLSGATIMAFVHNHPSGNTQPSKADDVLTQQIAKACQVMRLFFMDHVIVTDGAFYSYHDKGRL
jgi:hypothetical protein